MFKAIVLTIISTTLFSTFVLAANIGCSGGCIGYGYGGVNNVKFLQKMLGVEADGVFGAKTQAALRKWQKDNGIHGDGTFGNQTAQKMKEYYSSSEEGRAKINEAKDASFGNDTNAKSNLQNVNNILAERAVSAPPAPSTPPEPPAPTAPVQPSTYKEYFDTVAQGIKERIESALEKFSTPRQIENVEDAKQRLEKLNTDCPDGCSQKKQELQDYIDSNSKPEDAEPTVPETGSLNDSKAPEAPADTPRTQDDIMADLTKTQNTLDTTDCKTYAGICNEMNERKGELMNELQKAMESDIAKAKSADPENSVTAGKPVPYKCSSTDEGKTWSYKNGTAVPITTKVPGKVTVGNLDLTPGAQVPAPSQTTVNNTIKPFPGNQEVAEDCVYNPQTKKIEPVGQRLRIGYTGEAKWVPAK